MSDLPPTPEPVTPPVPDPPQPPAPPAEPPADPPELGDAGKRALDAERRRVKALQKQIDEMTAANLTEQERAVQAARNEGASEATTKANERILRSEVKLAAAGKLQDPGDALAYIDLSQFTVGDDGEVDSASIATAIDALVASKPYLGSGATPVPPPPGVPTGAMPAPLTLTLDQQIAEAEKQGDARRVIALNGQKLAEQAGVTP